MAKIVLSGNEFSLICSTYEGKEPGLVRWRDFSDCVDEVFTKKGLEKDVDMILNDARTQSYYGVAQPNCADVDLVD
jgi:hypothetical protein